MKTIYNFRTRKQGPAIVLTLERKAQDVVLELETQEISHKDEVNKILCRLNKFYKKDKLTQKHNALGALETHRRAPNSTIRDFLTEFN